MSESLSPPASSASELRRSPVIAMLGRSFSYGRTRFGVVLTASVVALALIGPYVAPHAPTDFVGVPYAGPSRGAPLGADYLGFDVLSQVLYGGRSILWMAV